MQVKIAVSKPAEKIKQSAYICYETQKLPILKMLFKKNPPERVIIFSSSKQKVKELARTLRGQNLKVAEMHSDLDQNVREEVMLKFKAGHVNVVVATDIISRGIDIDNIETVINYDVPHEPEDYVHRIGRTARADKEGSAITFISEREMGKFKAIERLLGKEVEKEEIPSDLGDSPDYSKSKRRGGKGTMRKEGSGRRKSRRDKPSAPKEKKSASAAEEANVTKIANVANVAPQEDAKPKKKRRPWRRRRKPTSPGKTSEISETSGA